LRTGGSTSCGCRAAELSSKRNKTHGLTKSRAYRIWCGMMQRCYNPNDHSYYYYGGYDVPVTVYEPWHTFVNYFAATGHPPPGLTLDRWPNKYGNYEPGNVRWATPLEQVQNRRPPKRKQYRSKLEDIQAFAASLARAASV
jgi:hypothetical protein